MHVSHPFDQVYRGLDVVTNKVTAIEQAGIRHHLIDFRSPTQPITAPEFRDLALAAIADIHARGKCAVIVGGTNYYIESVLFHNLIDEGLLSVSSRIVLPLTTDRGPQYCCI